MTELIMVHWNTELSPSQTYICTYIHTRYIICTRYIHRNVYMHLADVWPKVSFQTIIRECVS